MNITREEILRIRKQARALALAGKEEKPVKPSWKYRVAMATTKAPYNFKKIKARRKIAKNSRRINRHQ
jgi:hypothetical protein